MGELRNVTTLLLPSGFVCLFILQQLLFYINLSKENVKLIDVFKMHESHKKLV